jgi:SulP family sulfate permease
VSGTSPRLAWFAPTLHGYRRAGLGADVVAGLSAGAVVIPQAMAYATLANLPVQAGLYTCMVPMVVYALLGGSRAMNVSTTSTIATLTATTLVTGDVVARSNEIPRDLLSLTLLVGLILLAARALKLGALVENISKPTLVGIQVGVGLTVAVGQVPKLLGEDDNFTGHGFFRALVAAIDALPTANLPTVLLSLTTLALLFGVKALAPRVPGPLLAVVAGILLMAFTDLSSAGVAKIAEVPGGLPLPVVPTLDAISPLIPGACAIAVMAFLESTGVARGIRKPGEPQIDSNRELLATATANAAGSFFQTLPAAGGFSQSAVNQTAGARSQLSTLVTAALAVVVAVFLGPVLSLLPQATLAALVLVAVIGLINVRELVRLAHINQIDFVVAIVTAVVGLTTGLLVAVAVGVVFTLLLVFRELGKIRLIVSDRRDNVLPIRVAGPLYTANILGYESAVLTAVGDAEGVRAVALDLSRMEVTSVTVLDTLADLDRELGQLGVALRIAGLNSAPAAMARRTDWFASMEREGRVFADVESALRA